MKKEWPQSHVFDFDELEFQLKQEISKLEKQKQIQNQKTIKDKFIYQNARLQAEKWVQEEEERLKKYVPKFKMKM
ncbi:hypothetical protein [Mesomycoplasma hyopneumoniae]